MQHLELQRVASFDHEPPTIDELAHLAACRFCRDERAAMHELSQMAAHLLTDTPEVVLPSLTNWERLSLELRAEGLLTSAPSADVAAANSGKSAYMATGKVLPFVTAVARATDTNTSADSWAARVKPRNRVEWWRVAAAALMLVGAGGALGRVSAGATAFPGASGGGVATASIASMGLGSTGFSSLNEAKNVLDKSQRDYEHASLWLAVNDTARQSSDLVRRRLAALDQMVAASHSGLAESPNDPVLQHYDFAARAMREATLQQLGGALPVGRSIERF
jgi:predicted anti-sigma-YlaC factor YlaD